MILNYNKFNKLITNKTAIYYNTRIHLLRIHIILNFRNISLNAICHLISKLSDSHPWKKMNSSNTQMHMLTRVRYSSQILELWLEFLTRVLFESKNFWFDLDSSQFFWLESELYLYFVICKKKSSVNITKQINVIFFGSGYPF